jgi:hypothetical protein
MSLQNIPTRYFLSSCISTTRWPLEIERREREREAPLNLEVLCGTDHEKIRVFVNAVLHNTKSAGTVRKFSCASGLTAILSHGN